MLHQFTNFYLISLSFKSREALFWYTISMKPALIIVDMLQDFFVSGRLQEHRQNLVDSTNILTAYARKNSIPVIWVRQEFKADLSDAFRGMKEGHIKRVTVAGTEGANLLPELLTAPSDYEIIKKRYSAFYGTLLDKLLAELGSELLIIAGVNTHACVRMAAIDAYQRDYEVVLATDCIDSYDEEHHRISLEYLTRHMAKPKSNDEMPTVLG
jgi:nicotinamidase-related amidase